MRGNRHWGVGVDFAIPRTDQTRFGGRDDRVPDFRQPRGRNQGLRSDIEPNGPDRARERTYLYLRIGKTKILGNPVPKFRPIPFGFWREALTCSPWRAGRYFGIHRHHMDDALVRVSEKGRSDGRWRLIVQKRIVEGDT